MAKDDTMVMELRLRLDKAEKELSRFVRKAERTQLNLKGIDHRKFTQPLGKITGSVSEFQKSLEASNARVIAFTASAGILMGVTRAFQEMARATVEVEKSLKDINVIMGASTANLKKFGNELFNVAKQTGQSFFEVSQAATEFARQGLSMEKTLTRTRDALILTRLSGMDAAEAVNALTAAINSFSSSALTSTEIINRLANVDAAFAVSTTDLAEAIRRVGSSADSVNVSFNEMIAIVTSVQQTTARGGNVIGNSLKTIFTRIQRTDTINQMERLGVAVRDTQGQMRPAMKVLSDFARVYDKLNPSLKASTAEMIGGVYQMNILKAILKDLKSGYSTYSNALDVANNSTDEAIQRNKELNKTLSALINESIQNLTELGAGIGKITLEPLFRRILEGFNALTKEINIFGDIGEFLGFSPEDGNKFGKDLANNILGTFGNILSGPGFIALGTIIGKLFIDFVRFLGKAVKDFANLNKTAQQQAALQQQIQGALAANPQLIDAITKKEMTRADAERKILDALKQEIILREKINQLAAGAGARAMSQGYGANINKASGETSLTYKGKSHGFVPNFRDVNELNGALAGGYKPGDIRKTFIKGEGRVTYNTAEKIKKFPGMEQRAIMPPEESEAGMEYKKKFKSQNGFDPYASGGFIPNLMGVLTSMRTHVSNPTGGKTGSMSNMLTVPYSNLTKDGIDNGTKPWIKPIWRKVLRPGEDVKLRTMGHQPTLQDQAGLSQGRGRGGHDRGLEVESRLARRQNNWSFKDRFKAPGGKGTLPTLPVDLGTTSKTGRAYPVESKSKWASKTFAQLLHKTLYETNSQSLRQVRARLKGKMESGDSEAGMMLDLLQKQMGLYTHSQGKQLGEYTGGKVTSLDQFNREVGYDSKNAIQALRERKKGMDTFSQGFIPNFFALAQGAGVVSGRGFRKNIPLTDAQAGHIGVVVANKGASGRGGMGEAKLSLNNPKIAAALGVQKSRLNKVSVDFPFQVGGFKKKAFDDSVEKRLNPAIKGFVSDLGLAKKQSKTGQGMDKGIKHSKQVLGRLFETAIFTGLKLDDAGGKRWDLPWDWSGQKNFKLNKRKRIDIKYGINDSKSNQTAISLLEKSLATNTGLRNKITSQLPAKGFQKKRKSSGFIPNFSALQDALLTEEALGGEPVVDFDKRVGLYVRDGKNQKDFSDVLKDHPEGLSKAMGNSKKMQGRIAAEGFVPNFQGPTGLDMTMIAGSMGFLAMGSKQVAEEFKEVSTAAETLKSELKELEAEESKKKESTKKSVEEARSAKKTSGTADTEHRRATEGVRRAENKITEEAKQRVKDKGGPSRAPGKGTDARKKYDEAVLKETEALKTNTRLRKNGAKTLRENLNKQKERLAQANKAKSLADEELKTRRAAVKANHDSLRATRRNAAAKRAEATAHNQNAAMTKGQVVGGAGIGMGKGAGGTSGTMMQKMAMPGMMMMPMVGGAAKTMAGDNAQAKAAIGGVETGASMGMMASLAGVGGPASLAIGGVIALGAGLNALNDPMPALEKNLEKATSKLTEFSNTSSAYLTALDSLNEGLNSESIKPDELVKRQKKVEESFMALPADVQSKFKSVGSSVEDIKKTFAEISKDLQQSARIAQREKDFEGEMDEERGWFVNWTRSVGRIFSDNIQEADDVFDNSKEGKKRLGKFTGSLMREVDSDKLRGDEGLDKLEKINKLVGAMGSQMDHGELMIFTQHLEDLGVPPEYIDQMERVNKNQFDGATAAKEMADKLFGAREGLDAVARAAEHTKKIKAVNDRYREQMAKIESQTRLTISVLKEQMTMEKARIDMFNRQKLGRKKFTVDLAMARLESSKGLGTPFMGEVEKTGLDYDIKNYQRQARQLTDTRKIISDAIEKGFGITQGEFIKSSDKLAQILAGSAKTEADSQKILDQINDNQKLQTSLAPIMNKHLQEIKNNPEKFEVNQKRIDDIKAALTAANVKNVDLLTDAIRTKLVGTQAEMVNKMTELIEENQRQTLILKTQENLQKETKMLQERLATAGGASGYMGGSGGFGGLSKNLDKLNQSFDLFSKSLFASRKAGIMGRSGEAFAGQVDKGRANMMLMDFIVNNLNARNAGQTAGGGAKGERLGSDAFGPLIGMAVGGRVQDLKSQIGEARNQARIQGGGLTPELNAAFDQLIKDAPKTAMEQIASQLKLQDLPENVDVMRRQQAVLVKLLSDQQKHITANNRKAFIEALTHVGLTKNDLGELEARSLEQTMRSDKSLEEQSISKHKEFAQAGMEVAGIGIDRATQGVTSIQTTSLKAAMLPAQQTAQLHDTNKAGFGLVAEGVMKVATLLDQAKQARVGADDALKVLDKWGKVGPDGKSLFADHLRSQGIKVDIDEKGRIGENFELFNDNIKNFFKRDIYERGGAKRARLDVGAFQRFRAFRGSQVGRDGTKSASLDYDLSKTHEDGAHGAPINPAFRTSVVEGLSAQRQKLLDKKKSDSIATGALMLEDRPGGAATGLSDGVLRSDLLTGMGREQYDALIGGKNAKFKGGESAQDLFRSKEYEEMLIRMQQEFTAQYIKEKEKTGSQGEMSKAIAERIKRLSAHRQNVRQNREVKRGSYGPASGLMRAMAPQYAAMNSRATAVRPSYGRYSNFQPSRNVLGQQSALEQEWIKFHGGEKKYGGVVPKIGSATSAALSNKPSLSGEVQEAAKFRAMLEEKVKESEAFAARDAAYIKKVGDNPDYRNQLVNVNKSWLENTQHAKHYRKLIEQYDEKMKKLQDTHEKVTYRTVSSFTNYADNLEGIIQNVDMAVDVASSDRFGDRTGSLKKPDANFGATGFQYTEKQLEDMALFSFSGKNPEQIYSNLTDASFANMSAEDVIGKEKWEKMTGEEKAAAENDLYRNLERVMTGSTKEEKNMQSLLSGRMRQNISGFAGTTKSRANQKLSFGDGRYMLGAGGGEFLGLDAGIYDERGEVKGDLVKRQQADIRSMLGDPEQMKGWHEQLGIAGDTDAQEQLKQELNQWLELLDFIASNSKASIERRRRYVENQKQMEKYTAMMEKRLAPKDSKERKEYEKWIADQRQSSLEETARRRMTSFEVEAKALKEDIAMQEAIRALHGKKVKVYDAEGNVVKGKSATLRWNRLQEKKLIADRRKQTQMDFAQGNGDIGDSLRDFKDSFKYSWEDMAVDADQGIQDIGKSFRSETQTAFKAILDGTKSTKEAFGDMFDAISNMIQAKILEMTIQKGMDAVVGALGGRNGGLVSPTGIQSFAKGGEVLSPLSAFGGIKRLGGLVLGGSGTKDDVPAMLGKGEYVVRKSAVNKYGMSFLNGLNSGEMPVSSTSDPQANMSSMLEHRTSNRGAFSKFNLRNAFIYDSDHPSRGKSGYEIDPRLSRQALTDPDNPRNQVRMDKVAGLYDYWASRRQEIEEWTASVAKWKKTRRKKMQNALWMMAGHAAAGALFGQGSGFGTQDNLWTKGKQGLHNARINRANNQPQFFGQENKAKGGLTTGDNIPSMLMGGEYVIQADAVKRHGVDFFHSLNAGKLRKMADGGFVGGESTAAPNSAVSADGSSSNNISITVNIDQNGGILGESSGMGNEEGQRLAKIIETQITQTLIKEKRQGGILR